jgi:hypothetical protein
METHDLRSSAASMENRQLRPVHYDLNFRILPDEETFDGNAMIRLNIRQPLDS